MLKIPPFLGLFLINIVLPNGFFPYPFPVDVIGAVGVSAYFFIVVPLAVVLHIAVPVVSRGCQGDIPATYVFEVFLKPPTSFAFSMIHSNANIPIKYEKNKTGWPVGHPVLHYGESTIKATHQEALRSP